MSETDRASPACGAREPRPWLSHEEVAYVRCRGCGTAYHRDPPPWDRIEHKYQEAYYAQRGHADPAIEACKQATAAAYFRRLAHAPGRRLLEVGCSAGAGLAAAAAAGWQATGVELSTPAAEIARRRPGVRAVHTGRLEDAPLSPASFDAAVMFDVIEHIDPPLAVLRTLHGLLAPAGLLLLVTPEGDSLSARLLGRRWAHLFIEHVVLFSRRGLRTLLSTAGFEVLGSGFAWKRVNLDMLVRHARLHPQVTGGGVLRLLGRMLPAAPQRALLPFNIGEFWMLARRADATPAHVRV